MPGPLPLALRQRVLDAMDDEKLTTEEAATRFRIGTATVTRWLRRRRETGGVEPEAMGGDRLSKILPKDLPTLALLVEEMPDATESELVVVYARRHGVTMSRAAMSRALKRAGLTRKKRPSSRKNETRLGSRTPGTDSANCRG